jgi:hypothetical protein
MTHSTPDAAFLSTHASDQHFRLDGIDASQSHVLLRTCLSAFLARMWSTAGLLPGLAMVWTVFALADPLHLRLQPIITGLVVAMISWLTFAVLTIRLGWAHLSNAGEYSEVHLRARQAIAQAEALCSDDAPGQLRAQSSAVMRSGMNDILSAFDHHGAGIPWATGEGYVALWRRIHRVEETLFEASPVPTVVAEALDDRARLSGSTIQNRDELLRSSGVAIAFLAPHLATSLRVDRVPDQAHSGAPETPADAVAVLRVIRRAINEFRDDRRAGLARLHRRMMPTLVLTGTTAYLLLALAIIADVQPSAILTGCAYFLVGATVGLMHRAFGEMAQGSELEDYGLSTARLLNAPIVSGLAALGGVVLTAIVLGPPLGLDIMTHLSAPRVPLLDVFTVTTYPIALVIAAVFGLAPGLLFDRLGQVSQSLKVDLAKSTTAAQTPSEAP